LISWLGRLSIDDADGERILRSAGSPGWLEMTLHLGHGIHQLDDGYA
jgi:hypothetical protein